MSPQNVVMIRRISQIIFFITLVLLLTGTICSFILPGGFDYYCTFGALQILIASRTFRLVIIVGGAILLILTLFLGRAFCSWICPFGTLLDYVNLLLIKLKLKIKERENGKNIISHRANKYGVMAGGLLLAGVLRFPAYCAICPVGTTCRSLGLQGIHLGIEAMVIPLLAGLEIFRRRFWCKFLCPLGAILALVDRVSLWRLRLPLRECLNCGRCETACMLANPDLTTKESLSRRPDVIKYLLQAGCPDIFERNVAFADYPPWLQERLMSEIPLYRKIGPGECSRCYECARSCPGLIVKQKKQRLAVREAPSTIVSA